MPFAKSSGKVSLVVNRVIVRRGPLSGKEAPALVFVELKK